MRRIVPTLELALALAAAGLWYTQGGALQYESAWPGPWALGLLALAWALHIAAFGISFRPSLVDTGLWLFTVAAAMGVWAAYDPGPSLAKFWLVIGALGLFYALAHHQGREQAYAALAVWGLAGAGLAGYFFATNDWTAYPVKVPLLTELGESISAWVPQLVAHRLHPNVAGGILAILLPLYVPLVKLTARPVLRALWLLAGALVALTLAVTTSRGAWAGVAAAAALWALWRALGRLAAKRADPWAWRMRASAAITVLAIALGAAAAWAILAFRLPGAGTLGGRLDLLSSSALLARDYLFTGAGLGMFQMQYSLYTLLIHVGFQVHSHNIALNVLIEQGLPGLIGYALVTVLTYVYALRALRHAASWQAWALEAAIAAQTVLLVHGMVDDALYGSRGVLLLFVPAALVTSARWGESPKSEVRSPESEVGESGSRGVGESGSPESRVEGPKAGVWESGSPGVGESEVGESGSLGVGGAGGAARQDAAATAPRTPHPALVPHLALRTSHLIPIAAGTAIVVVALALAWRPLLAMWYANLGAVEQSRYELAIANGNAVFDLMDDLRRRPEIEPAKALFEQAIAYDPGNATARQRLAEIAMARGEYEDALTGLQAAWAAGNRDVVTRMLAGDALVANGEPEQAAEMIQGLYWGPRRMEGMAWGRYWINEDYRRAADAYAVVVMLEPGNTGAEKNQAEAEARARQE